MAAVSTPSAPASEFLHLTAAGVSVVLDLRDGRLPSVVFWGPALGNLDDAALATLEHALRPAPFGFSADATVRVGIVPEQSAGWLGTPGLVGSRDGRDFSPLFAVTAVRREVRAADGADVVGVYAQDAVAGLLLRVEVELHPGGVVRQRATVTNVAADPFAVENLSTFLPVPSRALELLDFTGHHLRERAPQRQPFTQGLRVRENRTGRTGYDTAYLLAAGTPGFDNRTGEVWGVHTAFSGNARTLAERTYHGGLALLGGGELLMAGEVRLEQGDSYASPWLYASYGRGLDEVSARFHDYLRARPQHPSSPRPVVVNTWEAVYFDHDLDRLTALAQVAASVGAERFVLDDGWFGSRRDDRRGLGDWYVSAEVWPDGLQPLIEVVTGLGMEFGLWVEPEMVNPDSDLARAHPSWMMQAGGRLPLPARSQQVLDLTEPDAFAYILGRLDALLTDYDISYLKWDHNRDLVEAGHAVTGRAGVHDQTYALYRLLDELRARHPRVEIESCSSGGGRVDLEILQRTDRVWASDCIDAHERVGIQRWTSLLIPLELIGSHVGTPTSHTTGRTLPIDARAGLALFGHLGIEWDLTTAADGELDRLRAWVRLYKEVRDLLHTGVLVHADVPDPAYQVTGVVARDGSEALYAISATATTIDHPPGTTSLPGLDPLGLYRLSPQAPGDVVDGVATAWGAPLPWWDAAPTLPGSVLATAGVRLPLLHPDRVVLVRATRVDAGPGRVGDGRQHPSLGGSDGASTPR